MLREEEEMPETELDKLARESNEVTRQRAQLDSERTFSAWLRTGLAAVIAGLGVSFFMSSGTYSWLAPLVASIFILTGSVIYVLAFWSYQEAYKQLRAEDFSRIPLWVLSLLVSILLVTSGISFFLLV